MPGFHEEKKVEPIEPLTPIPETLADKNFCLISIDALQKKVAELEAKVLKGAELLHREHEKVIDLTLELERARNPWLGR